MQAEAGRPPGYYDLVHSHYWLSGHVGWLAAERWGVPLVHAMHTMAKVKNATLADGDNPEPAARVIGETQIVEAADRLIANTDEEADELVGLYDADPARVAVVHPGVNLDRFRPGRAAPPPGARLGCRRTTRSCCCSSGRIQPLKAPDVLLRAVAALLIERTRRCATGWSSRSSAGRSGSGLAKPEALQKLAAELGHRRRRAVRPAGPPGPARRLVPGRVRARHAVVQRVLRARRDRGAGVRHAGGRGRGRRAAGRPSPTVRPASWSTGTTRALRRRAGRPRRRPVALRRRLGAAPPRHAGRFGWAATAAGDGRRLRRRAAGARGAAGVARSTWLTSAAGRHGHRRVLRRPPAELEHEEPTPGTYVVHAPRHPQAVRPRSASSSAGTPSRSTPSSSATPTRTTRASTAGCSSATSSCTA